MREKELCKIICQEEIAKDIYSMWLATPKIANEALAGQFISLYSNDSSRLLPRPISICEIDKENGQIRVVYRIAGAGTAEFANLQEGDMIAVIGPLGNGFPLSVANNKKVVLMGGGIGVPPMLELAKQLTASKTIICGYRDETFLMKELSSVAPLLIATEDGSSGVKGNVLDVVEDSNVKADIIFACGPTPMLRAIKAYAVKEGIECYISTEEKMACGIGACLACVCQSKEKDHHTNVNNKRICKDGPVFLATEVEL